ncbi:MAG: hypothetical protein HQK65_04555 [Desulfamplus sp.]|nr:hypothetical protein [Desulfamplus sp.]
MKKFSDFAKDINKIDGDKIKIEDILNKDIVVTDGRISKSKYRSENCLTIQFNFLNKQEKHIFFTGSSVLIDQYQTYKENIPFQCQIRKINKYFSFC